MNAARGDTASILLVDDNPVNLRLLSDILGAEGYAVRAAADGPLALKAVASRAPDLILLDINMPGMDGIEVCERLKEEEAWRAIPVIFISALNDTADKLRGFSAGGVDYITKPFAAEEVLARVRTHLALRDLQLRLERRVAERTESLLRANRQLAEYAEVAAHQLHEPLRMIASYAQLLEQRYRGKLDVDADEFIGYLMSGAARMQRLLDDLLRYSSIGQPGTGEMAPVACEPLVEEVVAALAPRIQATAGVVEHGPLPVVSGVRTELLQLFTQLIDNALSFHSERPPRVFLSARPEGSEWRFSVQDLGIGIDPRYQERIFRLFTRLPSPRAREGTGIGLALCKKILEHHGGRIWVESTPGQGATFHFTLPDPNKFTREERHDQR